MLALGLRVVVVADGRVDGDGEGGARVVVERVVARLRSGLGEGGRVLLEVAVVARSRLELAVGFGLGFGLLGDRALSGDEKRKRFRVFLFWSSSSSESSTKARLRRFAGGAIAGVCGFDRGVALVRSHWKRCGLKSRLCVSQCNGIDSGGGCCGGRAICC